MLDYTVTFLVFCLFIWEKKVAQVVRWFEGGWGEQKEDVEVDAGAFATFFVYNALTLL